MPFTPSADRRPYITTWPSRWHRWAARAHDVAGGLIDEQFFVLRSSSIRHTRRYPAPMPIPGKPMYAWTVERIAHPGSDANG